MFEHELTFCRQRQDDFFQDDCKACGGIPSEYVDLGIESDNCRVCKPCAQRVLQMFKDNES